MVVWVQLLNPIQKRSLKWLSSYNSSSLQNAINFDDYHDAKIESNIDYIFFQTNALKSKDTILKTICYKLNNIICGCYIIRGHTLILVFGEI
jgi:hypothetical protein